MDVEALKALLAQYEKGLLNCQAKEAEAMENRLRQEGAVFALRQLIAEAEQATQAVAAIAIPIGEGETDGGNH